MKKKLNPALVYVLSVLGFFCCCFGGLGFLLSGAGYLVAQNKIKDAENNPDMYEGGIDAMKTAKIIALVVTIINIIYLIVTIVSIATTGWDEQQRQWEEMMEQIRQQNQ